MQFLLIFIRAGLNSNHPFVIKRYRCCACTNALTAKGLANFSCQAPTQLQSLTKSIAHLYQSGLKPDQTIYKHLLQECSRLKSLSNGKLIHAHIIETGNQKDVFIQNWVIHMYGRCGDLENARAVFDSIHKKNVFSWTLMVGAYSQNGRPLEALRLFGRMRHAGVKPDQVILMTVLKVCSNLGALSEGESIHESISGSIFEFNVGVRTALIDMYAKCGNLEAAREAFEAMKERDAVSWNCIIGAYAQQGYGSDALQFFHRMELQGFKPDDVTYLLVINACSSPPNLAKGKLIHSRIIKQGIQLDPIMKNALIDMYGKCGCFTEAKAIFSTLPESNVLTWTSLIGAYTLHGLYKDAIGLFQNMQSEGVRPDKLAFLTVLSACCRPELLNEGMLIHSQIGPCGFEVDVILGNALVNMYCKCGSLSDACAIFYSMKEKNLVSWNAIISGHVLHGCTHEALDIFKQMQSARIMPDKAAYLSILNACASISALSEGRFIHGLIVDNGLESNLVVGNAIIDMYGKCGSLQSAFDVFIRMLYRDIISWNAMVVAQAQGGHGKEALNLLGLMQWEDMKPDEVTLINILSACRHAGLMEEGFFYIADMGTTVRE
ncbi:hypothetical protein O6H91_13G023000 [Diphasiastrum complanatum]|uniref:Uncharacterized protein n=1 Tax=Diphasiastrum complanatum TaxID=34168 RepID=A0ACC2BSX3_DIPCM|nr:hypothetical protein O6H91_13G023000 [Diphasiastrum complanatum]